MSNSKCSSALSEYFLFSLVCWIHVLTALVWLKCSALLFVITFMNKLVSRGFFWNTETLPSWNGRIFSICPLRVFFFLTEACASICNERKKERNTALNESHIGPTVVTHPFILLRRVVCLIICLLWIAGPWLAVCDLLQALPYSNSHPSLGSPSPPPYPRAVYFHVATAARAAHSRVRSKHAHYSVLKRVSRFRLD